MIRHFCSSADIRYATRLRVMIESLRQFEPEASFTILCLDGAIERWLHRWAGPSVTTVRIRSLEEADPRLRPLRRQRKPWEYYATLKAPFLLHVLQSLEPGSLLAFVDADTCFFSSPQALADETGTAPIAISPHRFSPQLDALRNYGRYNAGFGIWRQHPTGLRCLHDWSEDCIRWCHNRVENGKFMNQGYLDQWPRRYPDLVELQHPGHNLAPWNLDRHALRARNHGLEVDGQALIFFHFSHLFRTRGGDWAILDKWPGLRQASPLQPLFASYLEALDRAETTLSRWWRWRAGRSLRQPNPSKAHLNLKTWCRDSPSPG